MNIADHERLGNKRTARPQAREYERDEKKIGTRPGFKSPYPRRIHPVESPDAAARCQRVSIPGEKFPASRDRKPVAARRTPVWLLRESPRLVPFMQGSTGPLPRAARLA